MYQGLEANYAKIVVSNSYPINVHFVRFFANRNYRAKAATRLANGDFSRNANWIFLYSLIS